MAGRIEDYALIGDYQTAALVGRDGSIDWLCIPRFDCGACFASLLGNPENGRWRIAPSAPVRATRRSYREDTLVLETDFETDEGSVTVVDCMTPRTKRADLVRLVVGRRGRMAMRTELVIRFDYGFPRSLGPAGWSPRSTTRKRTAFSETSPRRSPTWDW